MTVEKLNAQMQLFSYWIHQYMQLNKSIRLKGEVNMQDKYKETRY
jgi:hypothetical protein